MSGELSNSEAIAQAVVYRVITKVNNVTTSMPESAVNTIGYDSMKESQVNLWNGVEEIVQIGQMYPVLSLGRDLSRVRTWTFPLNVTINEQS